MFNLLLFGLAQAESDPRPSTIIQKMILGILIIFVISVFSARFIAKAVRVYDSSFGKAFVATLFKNMAGWGSLAFLGLAPGVPHLFALAVSLALVPVFVYKVVFSSETLQAVLIWLGVFVVEFITGVGLSQAGLFDLQGLLKI